MVLDGQYVPSWFCDVLRILAERQPDVRYYDNGDFPFVVIGSGHNALVLWVGNWIMDWLAKDFLKSSYVSLAFAAEGGKRDDKEFELARQVARDLGYEEAKGC